MKPELNLGAPSLVYGFVDNFCVGIQQNKPRRSRAVGSVVLLLSRMNRCVLPRSLANLSPGKRGPPQHQLTFKPLTPNSHQAHLRIRTPRSLHTKNRYHTCKRQSKWAVSSCVHTECMCATMIADGFQPQMCAGAWCGLS